MLSRILTRLAVALIVLFAALVLLLHTVAAADPDLHGLFGWLVLLGVPVLLLAVVWVFSPRRRP
jgi:hypothetical protein